MTDSQIRELRRHYESGGWSHPDARRVALRMWREGLLEVQDERTHWKEYRITAKGRQEWEKRQ
jgi:DNA-binding PadR family transcriptional regulator